MSTQLVPHTKQLKRKQKKQVTQDLWDVLVWYVFVRCTEKVKKRRNFKNRKNEEKTKEMASEEDKRRQDKMKGFYEKQISKGCGMLNLSGSSTSSIRKSTHPHTHTHIHTLCFA